MIYSSYLIQEALKVTVEMNNSYHTPEELQQLFVKLSAQPVKKTLGLIHPFYADCGKNIHLGKHILISIGCTMPDQGGVYIGDGALIGHHATIVTFNHDADPQKRGDLHLSKVPGSAVMSLFCQV